MMKVFCMDERFFLNYSYPTVSYNTFPCYKSATKLHKKGLMRYCWGKTDYFTRCGGGGGGGNCNENIDMMDNE
eukprot:9022581-Ditylum_brightwellii.AAC.1